MEPRNFGHGDVCTSGAARAHVDCNWDVQFFREREVRIDRRVAGRKTFVLQTDFSHHLESVLGEVLAQLIQRDPLARRHSFVEAVPGMTRLGAASLHFCTLCGSPNTTAVTFSRSISATTSFKYSPFLGELYI